MQTIEIIDSLGEPRYLMPLEAMRPARTHAVFGDTANTPPLIPRSQWVPASLRTVAPPPKDQNGIGACNAFATVTAVEISRAFSGHPYQPLSAGYLYGNINGQRDRGSLLEDALEWMTQHGTCLASTVGMLDWQRSKWPAHAAEEAKRHRIQEYYLCPTFEHLASAIQYGFAGNIGIMWGGADNPDGDGWLPDRAAGRTGGHAIAFVGLVRRGDQWGIQIQNSWSPRWGAQGYAVLSETRIRSETGQFGWFVVRCATVADGSRDVPQPVATEHHPSPSPSQEQTA